MSKYVDGFVLVVPKGKADEYRKMAEQGRDSWMKHGALEYFECKGDDLKQQEMGPDCPPLHIINTQSKPVRTNLLA